MTTPIPINKTGLFQAGTLSSSTNISSASTPLDLKAWTKNIYDHNHDSHHLEFTNAVIDSPLNGVEPGRYDVFVDFSRGEFVVENRLTFVKHTWPFELRLTGDPIVTEKKPAELQPACEDFVIDEEPEKKVTGDEEIVGICVSSVGELLYGCEEKPLPLKQKKKGKKPPVEEAEHVCLGDIAKPPALCKNHTECHKKGYGLYGETPAFDSIPKALLDTVQVCPPMTSDTVHCEKCEWDGVCSLKFVGFSRKNMVVQDASGNEFSIPRTAVISYEEKKGKEAKQILRQLLQKHMAEEVECLLHEFGVSENQIEAFLASHSTQLKNAARKMYKEYEADGELDDLKNPENDWVREYMGEILKDIDFENECIRKAAGLKGAIRKAPSYLEIEYKGAAPKQTIVKHGYKYKLDGMGRFHTAHYARGKKVEK